MPARDLLRDRAVPGLRDPREPGVSQDREQETAGVSQRSSEARTRVGALGPPPRGECAARGGQAGALRF